MIVFGTDGWRGIIARDFTFDNLQLVAVATGNYVRRIEDKNPAVVIGYDTRFMSKDFAVETANLTRSQILQQAGSAMLAQANALPQNVLSLLRG